LSLGTLCQLIRVAESSSSFKTQSTGHFFHDNFLVSFTLRKATIMGVSVTFSLS
jgi:hypothetical protein